MAPIITFVARVQDGMLLVASMEHAGEAQDQLDIYKQQAKQILKKLNTRSPAKCSIESGRYCFHYIIDEMVCYLTLSDKGYPKRLAFCYLEEIQKGFVHDLEQEHGNWRHRVETVSRPYAFIKFDKFIQRKRKDYTDPNSRQNLSKLNEDLNDIHTIMKKNIQEVLNRGERLDNVSQNAQRLKENSRKFAWDAKKMNQMAAFKKYAPMAAVGTFVMFILYYFLF